MPRDHRSERVREPVSEDRLADLMERRRREGWQLAAVEWQRPEEQRPGTLRGTEVPYGLQVARDFLHLEENPHEVDAMIVMLDLMVDDRPLGAIAGELNERGFRTRSGTPWTQGRIFELMPRIVEAAPDIFGTSDWRQLRRSRRRRHLAAV